jgi:adenylate cyclase
MVGQAYAALGDEERVRWAAKRCMERCEKLLRVEPDHGGALGFFISALADLGEAERAREMAKRVPLFDPDNMRLRYNAACAMAKLAEVDTAVELLQPLVGKINRGWANWIDLDNSLDLIRNDPRFQAFRTALHARLPAKESSSSGA